MNTIGYGSQGLQNTYGKNSIGFYSNLSQMNDAKLNQILTKKGIGTNGKPSTIGTGSTGFLKEYQSKMSAMMSQANSMRGMNPSNVMGDLSISASDSKVLEAEAYYKLTEPAQYEVDVQQLASSQVNSSVGMKATDTVDFSGQLTIATSSRTMTINTDSLSGTTNTEKLNSLAKEINRYKSGVTAKVVTNDGKASLEITGSQTGKNKGFIVSGEFAEKTGLDTVAKEGQDAIYSVNGETNTSSTNTVNIGGYKVFATLKDTGKSTINVGADVDKTADKVQDLVDSFNSTLKLLNNNSDRGAGVLKQMRRMVSPPVSEDSLKKVGISINKDGTLALDKSDFKTAMKKNPSLTKDIISGSSGLAEGIYKDAQAGMKASSSSLVSSDLAKAQTMGNIDSMSFMNTYSKSGAYNMMNYYAVGSMMNFYV